jgi:hypothetical protein
MPKPAQGKHFVQHGDHLVLEISREQFKAYEAVRLSGVTNMFAVGLVGKLAGLTKDEVLTIMKNYEHYAQAIEKKPDYPVFAEDFEAQPKTCTRCGQVLPPTVRELANGRCYVCDLNEKEVN